MMSKRTNKQGFTLIEVLVSVSILAVSMGSILEGYRNILDAYAKARLSMEGLNFLEERMSDQELEIKGGGTAEGSYSGKEKSWIWSTRAIKTEQEGWYEIKGEIQADGNAIQGKNQKIVLYRYVRTKILAQP